MEINTYFHIHGESVEKRQESLHCLFACTVIMQAGQNAKDFFLLKVFGKQCQFCRNKLNIGKDGVFFALSLKQCFSLFEVLNMGSIVQEREFSVNLGNSVYIKHSCDPPQIQKLLLKVGRAKEMVKI